jgi:hypothetical protein
VYGSRPASRSDATMVDVDFSPRPLCTVALTVVELGALEHLHLAGFEVELAALKPDQILPVDVDLVGGAVPEVDEIHAMDNFSDRATYEIHVYGKDLVGLERCQYSLETGQVRNFQSTKFDNC